MSPRLRKISEVADRSERMWIQSEGVLGLMMFLMPPEVRKSDPPSPPNFTDGGHFIVKHYERKLGDTFTYIMKCEGYHSVIQTVDIRIEPPHYGHLLHAPEDLSLNHGGIIGVLKNRIVQGGGLTKWDLIEFILEWGWVLVWKYTSRENSITRLNPVFRNIARRHSTLRE